MFHFESSFIIHPSPSSGSRGVKERQEWEGRGKKGRRQKTLHFWVVGRRKKFPQSYLTAELLKLHCASGSPGAH